MKTKIRLVTLVICSLSICALVACAPRTMTDEEIQQSSLDRTPEFTLTWSLEMDCTSCHAKENNGFMSGVAISGLHKSEGLTCADCHSDKSSLTLVHENLSSDQAVLDQLNGLEKSVVTCSTDGCHAMSDDDFVALTAESTVLTDTRGTTVNPHECPTLTFTHEESDMTCDKCHRGHVDRTAEDYCLTCHHDAVYECGTCHV